MTVIGIDSHKDTLAACAVDAAGRPREHRGFANTPEGHAELACWAQAQGATRVAIEGSGNYGRPAAVMLAGAGWDFVEVPPQMTAAARRSQRTRTKTDPGDALAIARIGQPDADLPPQRPQATALCGALPARARRRPHPPDQPPQRRARTAPPGYHHRTGPLRTPGALERASRVLRGDHSARAQIARSRIKTLRALGRTIDSLASEIRDEINATGTTLRDIDGIGDLVAADILTETGDPTRFGTKAAFAMANGTAPIEAAPDASHATASTAAATASSTKPSTPPPSPGSPDPAPKAAATTNAASPAAKPNEKPSATSYDASQTESGPTSTPTP